MDRTDPIPGLPARELGEQIEGWLADVVGDPDTTARIMARLAGVITDAGAWRSYWDPAEQASRLEAELAAQRELDAAEWAPIAAHVNGTAARMLRRADDVDTDRQDYPGGNQPGRW